MTGYEELPKTLPEPVDDGEADHLLGAVIPSKALQSTSGELIDLTKLSSKWTVLYVYPMTGQPGVPQPTGWDNIPGARGCTPQTCGFRDQFGTLAQFDASIYGLSLQDIEYQREAVKRLHLPFALLSDADRTFGKAMDLPTFDVQVQGESPVALFKRLTMIVSEGVIKHVMYPVFPPDRNAIEVCQWLDLRS